MTRTNSTERGTGRPIRAAKERGARRDAAPAEAAAAGNGAVFVRRSEIGVSASEAFRWHARPGALERLTPPWSPVAVEERHGGIEPGGRVVLRIPVGPFSVRWVAQHTDYVEGRLFRDVQVSGPFARWDHTHRFEPLGPGACILEDRVEYALPLGPLGSVAGGFLVPGMLEPMFAYRHRITAGDLAAHARWKEREPQHFLVSGAGGLVGRALLPYLTTGGHRVTPLRRDGGAPFASVGENEADPVSAVVHLAGEPIAGARWNRAVKQRILESRVQGTRALCESLARWRHKPRVLVSASAIGFYGDRGVEPLDESAAPGEGFLAHVCREWEAATAPARDAGIRVVHLRIGVVLTSAGGAPAQLLTPFRLGAGGRLGDGRQYMSWIGLDDLLDAILHASMHDRLEGSVNAVSPRPTTNAEFTDVLGRVLRRPAWFPIPAPVARAVFGEMADEMLLASTRVEPARLIRSGFTFRTPTLDAALRHTLGRA